jgi:hypothetical protein
MIAWRHALQAERPLLAGIETKGMNMLLCFSRPQPIANAVRPYRCAFLACCCLLGITPPLAAQGIESGPWTKWIEREDLYREGIPAAEALRQELLAANAEEDSPLRRIANASSRFQSRFQKLFPERAQFSDFDVSYEAMRTRAAGEAPVAAGEVFHEFNGRWYGLWDIHPVDHNWLRPTEYSPPQEIGQGQPRVLSAQFAWIGDGFGWNYLVALDGKAERRVILGMVYHLDPKAPDGISRRRPHVGLSMGPSRLVWITKEEVFFEEVFGKAGDESQRYAITGFYHHLFEPPLSVDRGFQAVYTRSPNDRPNWHRVVWDDEE